MKSPTGYSGRHAAFTIIELLVVIAIIATLASILMPVFKSARDKARQTVCASNMAQTIQAYALYRQDAGEMNCPSRNYGADHRTVNYWPSGNPPEFVDPDMGGTRFVVPGLLHPYHKSLNIFRCPQSQKGRQLGFAINGSDGSPAVDMVGEELLGHMPRGVRDAQVEDTSFALFWDHLNAPWICRAGKPANHHLYWPPGTKDTERHYVAYHHGAANYGSYDGHIKSYRPDQLRLSMLTMFND